MSHHSQSPRPRSRTASHVLVLDDHPARRAVVSDALIDAGYLVTETSDLTAQSSAHPHASVIIARCEPARGRRADLVEPPRSRNNLTEGLIVRSAVSAGRGRYVAHAHDLGDPLAVAELMRAVDDELRTSESWRKDSNAIGRQREIAMADSRQLWLAQDEQVALERLTDAATRAADPHGAAFISPTGIIRTAHMPPGTPFTPGANLSPGLMKQLVAGCSDIPITVPGPSVGLATDLAVTFVPMLVAGVRRGYLAIVLPVSMSTRTAEIAIRTVEDLVSVSATPLAAFSESTMRTETDWQRVIDRKLFYPVFEPIIDLVTGEPVGYDTTFTFFSGKRADVAFADAFRSGLGPELETAAIRLACERASDLPDDLYLNVSVSAQTATDAAFLQEIAACGLNLIVGISELDALDPTQLRRAFTSVRRHASVCFEDAGLLYAGARHLKPCAPDLVKLDPSLVDELDRQPVARVMVSEIVESARSIGARVVASGVETVEEVVGLLELGVGSGQGYAFGAAEDLDYALEAA